MGYLAVNIPECQAATHTTHPYYPSWRKLDEKHFHRRKTGYQLYLNARQKPSDQMRLDWSYGKMSAWRRRTDGPLAGWYATLALGAKCLISYDEDQALVGASENRTEWIPLPPKAKLERVTRLLHDGTEKEYEYILDKDRNRIRLYIEDCGKDVLYYRIRYALPGQP